MSSSHLILCRPLLLLPPIPPTKDISGFRQTGRENLAQKQKEKENQVLGCNLKNNRMFSVHFQGKPFNTTVSKVYAPTSNAEEAEVEQFYEDLQDLELTPQKDVLFIIGDLNAKVGSQEITWSNRQIWPWNT